jgi:hypothetical protein
MLLKIRHRIALKLMLSLVLTINRELFTYRNELPRKELPSSLSPPRELFMYGNKLSLGSCRFTFSQTYRAYYPVVFIPTRLLTVLIGPQRGYSSRAWEEKQVSMYCTYRASNNRSFCGSPQCLHTIPF